MAKSNLEIDHQIAELASLMAVAIDSGLSLVAALEITFISATGEVAKRFQRLLAALDLGGNLYDELARLRSVGKDQALNELVIKLQVSLQFGSPLAEQLAGLARSLRHRVAQQQLMDSTKKENLMLLPLVFLILPVTVLFAIFPALQYLNLNY